MKRRPWRFKGLPLYKHPVISRLPIVSLIFGGSLFIIFRLPPDVPEKYKLIFFMICAMVCFWILYIPLSVLTKWYEANKAERAKNEALFLQQQKDEEQRALDARHLDIANTSVAGDALDRTLPKT